jgi:hypothetical protein
MDLLTTLAFLSHGGQEMNPLVAALLHFDPLVGLLLAKGVAVALAILCFISGRQKLVLRANIFYAGLIAWNVLAIIAGGTA